MLQSRCFAGPENMGHSSQEIIALVVLLLRICDVQACARNVRQLPHAVHPFITHGDAYTRYVALAEGAQGKPLWQGSPFQDGHAEAGHAGADQLKGAGLRGGSVEDGHRDRGRGLGLVVGGLRGSCEQMREDLKLQSSAVPRAASSSAQTQLRRTSPLCKARVRESG